jgi:ketosteroid isomerase-like protein
MSQQNVEIVRGVRIGLPPLGEGASQRRSLDERLFILLPSIYRLFADRVMRLSPGSRIRRLMLTRLVRRGYAASSRRDFEVLLLGLDPGIEYHPSVDLTPPDMESVSYGHDGYLKVWRGWLDAFEDIRLEPEELLDLGDKLLVTIRTRGHGSGSGVAVGREQFQLFHLRRGLVVWQQDFSDRSEALEAAGLRE